MIPRAKRGVSTTKKRLWHKSCGPYLYVFHAKRLDVRGTKGNARAMAKRQRIWAQNERARLVQLLGAKCNACGETEELEFDCREPRGRGHHGMSSDQRISFYRAEMRKGNIQLLCRVCNAKKGDMTDREWRAQLNTDLNQDPKDTTIKACEHCEQPPHARPPREDSIAAHTLTEANSARGTEANCE